MPTLTELFEQAKASITGDFSALSDKDKADAVEALKKNWNPFYQHIVNIGFGAANATHQKDITTFTERVTAAENRVKELQGQLADKSTPDAKTLNEQWQKRLDDQKKADAELLEKSNQRFRAVVVTRDDQILEDHLVALKVPKPMAKVLARDSSLQPRRIYDEFGNVSVRQAGADIPFSPASGQTHLSLLADEIFASVPKEVLVSDADGGSGVRNDGGRSGSSDEAYYEGLRKEVKSDDAAPAPLADRLKSRGRA